VYPLVCHEQHQHNEISPGVPGGYVLPFTPQRITLTTQGTTPALTSLQVTTEDQTVGDLQPDDIPCIILRHVTDLHAYTVLLLWCCCYSNQPATLCHRSQPLVTHIEKVQLIKINSHRCPGGW
jgi:hypothetical protein